MDFTRRSCVALAKTTYAGVRLLKGDYKMATTNVACPYCGKQTCVTVPTWTDDKGRIREYNIKEVVQNPGYTKWSKTTFYAACPDGHRFGALF